MRGIENKNKKKVSFIRLEENHDAFLSALLPCHFSPGPFDLGSKYLQY